MTDIFFSYSSVDRERVRPIRDALVAQGFEVFWDQQVPTGLDWDSWIRQHLTKSKCAMAFWSSSSVASDNVRHEATVAKQQGKLISVLLEPLTAQQFPMGLYAQQAANLSNWNGDQGHDEWRKFRREYEAKLTPLWVRRQIDELEAELVGERARREGVERRDKILQAQIAKEAETQLGLQRERDSALDETAGLKAMVEELTRARSEAEAREADILHQVAALRATVDEVTRARSDAEQRLSKLRQIKAKEIVRSVSPFVIAAAVATVGIWTYQLIWPAPQPLPAVMSELTMEAQREQAAIREEQLRQAAADTQAKLEAAEGEQQRLKDEVRRQAKAATDADGKRRATEAEQQRLKDELQRQTKLAEEADAKRRAAEAEQQRLAALMAEQEQKAKSATVFEIRRNMEARPKPPIDVNYFGTVVSGDECQQKCAQSTNCNVFSFSKASSTCYSYSIADFVPNTNFDSGVRNSAALPADQPAPTVTTQGGALAGHYPTKPVTMVIPFAAGGASDILGRVLAPRMSELLGQPVVVENVPGGGGTTGSKRVADAAPEGYNFVLGSVITHAQSQIRYKNPPYTAADFTPAALIAELPWVLIARKDLLKDLPVNNLQQFIAYAKTNQSKMRYGSAGAGSSSHLGCMLLNSLIGVDITHVPNRGMQDLQAGRIDYLCDYVITAKRQIDGGTVKPIAIMAKERSSALPNVPTGLEQGISNLEAYTWYAFFLSKGTPADVVKKLNDATVRTMKTPTVRERLEALGFVIVPEDRATPEQLGQLVQREIEKWAPLIKASGVTVD